MRRKLAVGAAAVAAVTGGGAVVATAAPPKAEDDAILTDVAKELGVQESALSSALEKALAARVDAAVAAGELTNAQAAELKARIAARDVPLFAVPHGRLHGGRHGPGLDAAAEYLDMTEAELRGSLDADTNLADVAAERGKTVTGLVDALVREATARLDAAVSAGRLTAAQRDARAVELRRRITAFVNGEGPSFRGRFGPHGPPDA